MRGIVDLSDLGEAVDLAVCDVSFISVTLIVPAMVRVLKPDTGRMVILVKPQFEVGKGQVGKGGIVRDPAQHAAVCAKVRACVEEAGFLDRYDGKPDHRGRRQQGIPSLCSVEYMTVRTAVRKVAIFAKPNSPQAVKLVPELLAWLAQRGIEARFDNETAHYAGMLVGLDRALVPEGCDLAIVLGGDGTLLSAARAVGNRAIPILAVNLGGLGFLTAITIDDFFPELERALTGHQKVTRRKMLKCSLLREGVLVAEYQALNDVVIAKSSIARIVDLEAWVGDSFICEYKADGLIISTPTGSTAYSLAAGGPIIYPTVNAFCLTPICPHTLTNRPLIIPSEMGVRVVNKAREEEAFLTVDGQIGSPLEIGDCGGVRAGGF